MAAAQPRLLRDLEELRASAGELFLIAAAPLDEDIHIWHCNVAGPAHSPFANGVFHMIVRFPLDYPARPPTVTLCTYLSHPNVHTVDGAHTICADFLSAAESLEPYSGWTPACSALSILVQLQAFLMGDDGQYSYCLPTELERAIGEARHFVCAGCGHRPDAPLPALPESARAVEPSQPFLRPRCFFTRATSDEAILGHGLQIARHAKKKWRGRNAARSVLARFNLRAVTDVFDVVSLAAFADGRLRKAALTHAAFSHFLPLYIDAEHAARARPTLLASITAAATDEAGAAFDPAMVLRVLPAAMTTVMVTLLSGAIHVSTTAIETYLALQRLLVHCVAEFPELDTAITSLLDAFVADEGERTKSVVPSLGELLALLSVAARHRWQDVAMPFLTEFLTRNTLWALQAHPELADACAPTADRLRLTFDANETALRLVLFHVHLMKTAPWSGGAAAAAAAVTSADVEALRAVVRGLADVRSWSGFLSAVGIEANAEELADLLVYAMRRSEALGYHMR